LSINLPGGPHFNRLIPVVIAAALTACATETTQLNSERIQSSFGNFGIDVRSNTPSSRRASLYSSDADGKTCRTYALVQYLDTSSDLITDEHRKIAAGGSMGATFKAGGWTVLKKSVHIGTLKDTSANSIINPLMRLAEPHDLALHIYQLSVVKNDVAIDYAVIAEAHHPDYLSEADLLSLYGYDRRTSLDMAYVNEIKAQIVIEE